MTTKNENKNSVIASEDDIDIRVGVDIPKPKIKIALVNIIGTSELIVHRFSEKSRKEIADKQAKKIKTAKAKRNPNKEYQDSFYRVGEGGVDGWEHEDMWDGKTTGIKAIGIKKAMVNACRQVDNIAMTEMRGMVFIPQEYLAVEGVEPYMRTDTVRLSKGSTDLRYRPAYPVGWKITVPIQYDEDLISQEAITHLLMRSGFGVGLCEHRPEKNGDNGTFEVSPTPPTEKEVKRITKSIELHKLNKSVQS